MRRKLIFLVYRILLAALLPLVPLYWLRRALRDPRYRRGLAERIGFLPSSYQRTVQRCLWLHAVSVGEVISSIELIRRWKAEHPDAEVFVSCATVAGREVAEARLKTEVAGIFYVPVDYVFAVRQVLRRIRPALVVVMETEIWPNLWRESQRSGARLVIVNGRISDRALPSYRRWRSFFAPILSLPDALLVQSLQDQERYVELGALPDRIQYAGNLKYDFNPSQSPVPAVIAELLDRMPERPVWIAASTMPPADESDVDEDDIVLSAFGDARRTRPDLFLILVPRKPERFDLVAQKIESAGLAYVRRSALPTEGLPDVLLLDSMGELASLFARAAVVFMGGTLARRGGHNILEPAFFGKPVIVGPHMENFAEIAVAFEQARAVRRIATPDELASAVVDLLQPGELGERARVAAQAQRGATERALSTMREQYDRALPRALPCWPLWLLSRVWLAGGWAKRAITRTRRLSAPVVSIGGIGMGGSGKTPVTDFLAAKLVEDGSRVAILTRGYGRSSSQAVVLQPGTAAPMSETGDEAQIYLHSGQAAVGISADRYDVGRRMEADIYLLDDGFQHARLERSCDVVVLDALDPFAACAPFPLGRMRENFESLGRADAFLIHRADPTRRYPEVIRILEQYNPKAPIFRSTVIAECWVNAQSGERRAPEALLGERYSAVCALANPDSFRDTLRSLNYAPEVFHTFPDHHRYTVPEISGLLGGEGLLLTTEKDAVKLPRDPRIWYLRIGIRIDRAEAFLHTVRPVCGKSVREPR